MTEEELRKHVGDALRSRRKMAGFSSAKAFAAHVGIPSSAYIEYETGRVNISFERAWLIADALGCSLDELGGRPGRVAPGRGLDPYQEELLDLYGSCNSEGKMVILSTARGQRELSLKIPEGHRHDAGLSRAASI